MPLDNISGLPFVHQKLAEALSLAFGSQKFSSQRAADVLNMKRASTAAYLFMLVNSGVVYKTREGIYSMVPIKTEPEPRKRAASEPNPPMLIEDQDDDSQEPESPQTIFNPRRVYNIHDAVRWLVEREVSVKPLGAVYLLENRQRVTEEQLITIVNKRLTKPRQVRQWQSMAAYVPSDIPFPSPERLRAGR